MLTDFSFLVHLCALTQIGSQNSLELIEDPKAEAVEELAAKLGLRKVSFSMPLKNWGLVRDK